MRVGRPLTACGQEGIWGIVRAQDNCRGRAIREEYGRDRRPDTGWGRGERAPPQTLQNAEVNSAPAPCSLCPLLFRRPNAPSTFLRPLLTCHLRDAFLSKPAAPHLDPHPPTLVTLVPTALVTFYLHCISLCYYIIIIYLPQVGIIIVIYNNFTMYYYYITMLCYVMVCHLPAPLSTPQGGALGLFC